MKILYICTGNTCRSPMAEGITNAIAAEYHTEVTVLSAGLYPLEGQEASPFAIDAISSFIDIHAHRARAVKEAFVDAADWILTMTTSQKEELIYRYPTYSDKIRTLNEVAGIEGDILDPYGQSASVYEDTAKQIERAIRQGWSTLLEIEK